MARKQVAIKNLMKNSKKQIKDNTLVSAIKNDYDRAKNLKDVKNDMNRIKSHQGTYTGRDMYGNKRTTRYNSNGTALDGYNDTGAPRNERMEKYLATQAAKRTSKISTPSGETSAKPKRKTTTSRKGSSCKKK